MLLCSVFKIVGFDFTEYWTENNSTLPFRWLGSQHSRQRRSLSRALCSLNYYMLFLVTYNLIIHLTSQTLLFQKKRDSYIRINLESFAWHNISNKLCSTNQSKIIKILLKSKTQVIYLKIGKNRFHTVHKFDRNLLQCVFKMLGQE